MKRVTLHSKQHPGRKVEICCRSSVVNQYDDSELKALFQCASGSTKINIVSAAKMESVGGVGYFVQFDMDSPTAETIDIIEPLENINAETNVSVTKQQRCELNTDSETLRVDGEVEVVQQLHLTTVGSKRGTSVPPNEAICTVFQVPLKLNISNLPAQPTSVSNSSVSSPSRQTDTLYVPTGCAESQSHHTSHGKLSDVEFGHEKNVDPDVQHALHHCVHEGTNCPYNKNGNACEQYLDKDMMESLRSYLNNSSSAISEDCVLGNLTIKHEDYVIDHLTSRRCGIGCPLWKFYIKNEMYISHNFVLKYADEGLVIYSQSNESKIGTVTTEYYNYHQKDQIGSGGFGKVYQHGRVAVKEEKKRPIIIADGEMFKLITQLKDDNVITMKEYVVGRMVDQEKGKRAFLFVMPFMNERGLHEQFKTHVCIIDYMRRFPDEENVIFNNFLILFLHVFQGLEYLHGKGIVHADVKDANILVHQMCSCPCPLRCKCPSHNGVKYVLTDLDVLCLEGKSVTGKFVKWTEMKFYEPAGTKEMKASELYFTGKDKNPCVNSKTDIWAGCVAMMNALVGKEDRKKAIKWIKLFLDEVTTASGNRYMNYITNASDSVEKIQRSIQLLDFSQERPKDVQYMNTKARNLVAEFKKLKDLLKRAQWIAETRSVSEYTYAKKFPLELILSAVHVANSLYQPCLEKLPHIYGKQLWTLMRKSLQIIIDGVRFLPRERPTATEITQKLIPLIR